MAWTRPASARTPGAAPAWPSSSIQEDGERDFLFYFDPARDLALRAEELDTDFLRSARAFHYGSISLIAEPCRAATLTAARLAREGGALISYDPNLRPRLWPDEDSMRRHALAGFAEADVAKVSKEELFFLVPEVLTLPETMHELTATGRLMEANAHLRLVCVTDGANGSSAHSKDANHLMHIPGFAVKAIDATGAGDAYMAGLLTFLLRQGPDREGTFQYIRYILKDLLTYANACGALAATELGAGMESLSEAAVQKLLAPSVS